MGRSGRAEDKVVKCAQPDHEGDQGQLKQEQPTDQCVPLYLEMEDIEQAGK